MTKQQAITLGRLIRRHREAAGLSLQNLGSVTEIAKSWLVYLEAGRSLEPSPDRMSKIAEALQIDPAEIDDVTGNYLARSLPTVRTYFRSKGKASDDELDELERVIREVQARYRGEEGNTEASGAQR